MTTANEVFCNDVVAMPMGSGYGVVTRIYTYGHRTLANVHYIDASTGNLRVCPDDRCQGKSQHCPIHQRSFELHELLAFNERDLRYYAGEGMLAPELLAAALLPVIKVNRSPVSHRLTVTRIRKVDRATEVRVERVYGYSPGSEALISRAGKLDLPQVLHDGTDEDYLAFAALFSEDVEVVPVDSPFPILIEPVKASPI